VERLREDRQRVALPPNNHTPISRALGRTTCRNSKKHLRTLPSWGAAALGCQARDQLQILAARGELHLQFVFWGLFWREILGRRRRFCRVYSRHSFTVAATITLPTVCTSTVDYCSCKCPSSMSRSRRSSRTAEHLQHTAT
jgi:hypothetical protein